MRNTKLVKRICMCCGKEFIPNTLRDGRVSNAKYCQNCQNKTLPSNTRTCAFCGKKFKPDILPSGKYSKSNYCSDECYKSDILPPARCLNCNNYIYYYDNQGHLLRNRRFCSKDCELQYNKKYKTIKRYCKCCNKEITHSKYAKFCSDFCRKKFEAENCKKVYCQVCGKVINLYDENYNRLTNISKTYCSDSCRKIDFQRKYYDKYNSLICDYCGKKYSVTDSDYSKENNIHRGTDFYHYCSKECADLAREKKKQQTCIQKYGVDCISKVRDIREKAEETMLAKYGVKYSCLLPQTIENNKHTISKVNREFLNLLCEVFDFEEGKDAVLEFRVGEYNYDIGIPNLNIVIDINPTYTHSLLPSHWDIASGQNYGKEAIYHINRTKMAANNNYRCIHVWQWDSWFSVLDLIKPKQKLYARKLQLKEISKQEANQFINQYHLQGSCYGNSVNLGLYQNEELVQVMTFGKPRYNKNYEWELLRLCTCSDYYIVGGAEKLFKYFIKTQSPKSVISYCDISKFTGDVYTRLGFELKEQTKPQKIWSKDNKYITDNLLRQRGADQLIGTHDGKGTDNEEIMIREGWRPVYDCGQKVFVYPSI